MGVINQFIHRAERGQKEDVDYLMSRLTKDATIATTRFADYALSFVHSREGIERMEYYLFNGTLMQRNYSTLYFNRKGDWKIVKRAYEMGLIDEIQVYSR